MGKFKQLQIDIDDDYVASLGNSDDEPVNKESVSVLDWSIFPYINKDVELTKTYIACVHEPKVAITRKTIVTYCKHCGKILDSAKR